MPLLIPSDPALVDTDDLMAACDGFLFTGARANVHPEEYGEAATQAHGAFDRQRDAVALPLIRSAKAQVTTRVLRLKGGQISVAGADL